MKSYEKQLEEFGYEIADEIIKKERDHRYEPCLEQHRIARSLSSIHDHGLRKTTEDLDKAVNKALYKMRNN